MTDAELLDVLEDYTGPDCPGCILGWPMCPACADAAEPYPGWGCVCVYGHVTPRMHEDYLAMEAEGMFDPGPHVALTRTA